MRGPHAGAKDAGRGRHQRELSPLDYFSRSDKEIYCGEAAENTNKIGEQHQSDVVLLRDTAVENPEHSDVLRSNT